MRSPGPGRCLQGAGFAGVRCASACVCKEPASPVCVRVQGTGFAGVCVCKEARTHLSTPLRRLLDAAEDLALCTTTPAAH